MSGAERSVRWLRTRRWQLALALSPLLSACNPDTGSGVDGSDTGSPCLEELPAMPPASNPDFVGVISGDGGNDRFTKIVSANIARTKNDAACCQDFVLAGNTNTVTIKFGAGYDGLTFLADRSDETISIGAAGQHARDLAVGDLNNDNRNDIVVLRSDGRVIIALAIAAPPANGPYFGATSTVTMNGVGFNPGTSLALGDMDGDGDLDLLVASTTTNEKLIWRKNNGNGTFGALQTSAAGLNTQRIALGYINNDAWIDVVLSGDDGRFSYLRSTQSGFAVAKIYNVWAGQSTPGMPIAVGPVCAGSLSKASVAVAYWDEVAVVCGNGGDGFTGVVEPHGAQIGEVDYFWDPTVLGSHSTNHMNDVAISPLASSAEVFALSRLREVTLYALPTCGATSGAMVPFARWGSQGNFTSLTVHREAKGDPSWRAVSSAGTFGLLSVH